MSAITQTPPFWCFFCTCRRGFSTLGEWLFFHPKPILNKDSRDFMIFSNWFSLKRRNWPPGKNFRKLCNSSETECIRELECPAKMTGDHVRRQVPCSAGISGSDRILILCPIPTRFPGFNALSYIFSWRFALPLLVKQRANVFGALVYCIFSAGVLVLSLSSFSPSISSHHWKILSVVSDDMMEVSVTQSEVQGAY